jgi:hypothetical protein
MNIYRMCAGVFSAGTRPSRAAPHARVAQRRTLSASRSAHHRAAHAAQKQSRDGGGEQVEVYAGLTRHTPYVNLKINAARATADRIILFRYHFRR